MFPEFHQILNVLFGRSDPAFTNARCVFSSSGRGFLEQFILGRDESTICLHEHANLSAACAPVEEDWGECDAPCQLVRLEDRKGKERAELSATSL